MFPINVKSKCPDTMFAINRILNVNERIIFLISSIKTINLIRAIGVPLGTRWANILFVKFVHPKIINPSHIGKEIIIFMEMCLVGVKIFGNSPIMFTYKIIKNKEIKIPFLLSLFLFNAILNCSLILSFRLFIIIFVRLGLFQNFVMNKVDTRIKIIQLNSHKILLFGSKERNKLRKNFSLLSFLFTFFIFFSVVHDVSFKFSIKIIENIISKIIKGIDIGKICGI